MFGTGKTGFGWNDADGWLSRLNGLQYLREILSALFLLLVIVDERGVKKNQKYVKFALFFIFQVQARILRVPSVKPVASYSIRNFISNIMFDSFLSYYKTIHRLLYIVHSSLWKIYALFVFSSKSVTFSNSGLIFINIVTFVFQFPLETFAIDINLLQLR